MIRWRPTLDALTGPFEGCLTPTTGTSPIAPTVDRFLSSPWSGHL